MPPTVAFFFFAARFAVFFSARFRMRAAFSASRLWRFNSRRNRASGLWQRSRSRGGFCFGSLSEMSVNRIPHTDKMTRYFSRHTIETFTVPSNSKRSNNATIASTIHSTIKIYHPPLFLQCFQFRKMEKFHFQK